MKVHVIAYFPCDSKEPFLFNAAQEIKDDTTVKKMVTAALQAASPDMAFDDILSDTDKEIIAEANHFIKTVKLTKRNQFASQHRIIENTRLLNYEKPKPSAPFQEHNKATHFSDSRN